MKRTLLLAICFLTLMFGFAQTETITIPWDFFVVPSDDPAFGASTPFDTRFMIEEGDTVVWEWIPTTGFHNVKSVAGQAVETFGTPDDPGDTNTTYGPPYSFSHTFTTLGENKFECTPHATLMYGFITVMPEGTLSVSSAKSVDFAIAPNPAKNNFTLELESLTNNTEIKVYDVLGKKVFQRKISAVSSTYDVSKWSSGVYLVRISSDNQTVIKRFVKQ